MEKERARSSGAERRIPPDSGNFRQPVSRPRYTIEIVCPEFTSVCPKTGQPDFGTLTFTYVPGRKCVELKSLKLYLQQFRNEGIFYEHATNRILDDLVAVVAAAADDVAGPFTPRGGITTSVTVTYPDDLRR